MENNIRFDRGNYNEETFLFKIDNASFLPSFEGILHEVIKHVPSDYKVSHDYSESDDGRVLYMEFTKPFAFGPFRGTDYINCDVRQYYHKSHKSLKNEYKISLSFFVGESISSEENIIIQKISTILIVLGILGIIGGFFIHGIFFVLVGVAAIAYKCFISILEKQDNREKKSLLYYCEQIFNALNSWEKDINDECRENAQINNSIILLNDKITSMKDKLSSNDYKGYKIAEDGTIIR